MTFDENAVFDYEGIVRNKKIYYAILAHKNEEALAAQVRNIRHFNPNAGIIIYNGGTDPEFGKRHDTLIYPNCHPIRYGNLTPYFWEIMKWLEENHVEYKYLINLDHDVLFVKPGFEEYLDRTMKEKELDVLGWDMVVSRSPSDTSITCCRDMWKEWDIWGPLFGTDSFIRFLNSTQVYHHDVVRRMLETDHRKVEEMISNSKVFALEEIFFPTLAYSKGARIGEYPREVNWKRASRFRGQITLEEAQWVKEHPFYYWIHPVKEARLIRLSKWLTDGELPPEESKLWDGDDAPGTDVDLAEPQDPALEQARKGGEGSPIPEHGRGLAPEGEASSARRTQGIGRRRKKRAKARLPIPKKTVKWKKQSEKRVKKKQAKVKPDSAVAGSVKRRKTAAKPPGKPAKAGDRSKKAAKGLKRRTA